MDAILNKDAMDDKVVSVSLSLSYFFNKQGIYYYCRRKRYTCKMIRNSNELTKKQQKNKIFEKGLLI